MMLKWPLGEHCSILTIQKLHGLPISYESLEKYSNSLSGTCNKNLNKNHYLVIYYKYSRQGIKNAITV